MTDDNNFWKECFRKSPIVTSVMIVGGFIGIFAGVAIVGEATKTQARPPAGRNEPMKGPPPPRGVPILSWVGGLALGVVGAGVGLVVGVVLESIVGLFFRGDKKKKKKKKRRVLPPIYEEDDDPPRRRGVRD
jgi:hypothetical protein